MHTAVAVLILILTCVGIAAGRIAWLRVDHTAGKQRDDLGRFRQRYRQADHRVPVRDDDHLGSVRRIGVHRFLRPHDHRQPARVPITILSLGFAVFWLALTRTLPLLPQG